MVDKPNHENPNEEPLDGQMIDDLPEDPFLTESLSHLASVNVPSGFLPNVMYRVYEKHNRDKLSPIGIGLICLALSLLCVVFFALDVDAYRQAASLADFNHALARKTDLLSSYFDGTFTGISGIFLATWHIITGAVSSISAGLQILLVAGILLVIYLINKGMSSLMGR